MTYIAKKTAEPAGKNSPIFLVWLSSIVFGFTLNFSSTELAYAQANPQIMAVGYGVGNSVPSATGGLVTQMGSLLQPAIPMPKPVHMEGPIPLPKPTLVVPTPLPKPYPVSEFPLPDPVTTFNPDSAFHRWQRAFALAHPQQDQGGQQDTTSNVTQEIQRNVEQVRKQLVQVQSGGVKLPAHLQ